MQSINTFISKKSFRYLLLGLGLIAIITLTGMNVYSLYDIRDKISLGEEERQMALLDDLVRDVTLELYTPFLGLNKLELDPVEYSIEKTGQFPPQLQEKLLLASQSSIYDGLYYTPVNVDPCLENSQIYAFDYFSNQLELTNMYPTTICDGVGLARTKAQIELNSFDYRWNYNIEFDAHRTMNISFININENKIIGYFTTTLNKDYIVNDLINPLMQKYFNPDSVSGTVLWLHDWANEKVLTSNDPTKSFDMNEVDNKKRFLGSMFDTWNLKIAFTDNAISTAYNATLIKNLVVLGFAVLFLMGALLFMFYTAQRERELAQRQAGFLANVTHELKTPLAVMQAAGENISDGRVKDQVRLKQYGDHIYSEAIRLRKMIEKLLDVAKTDSNQIIIKAKPVNINTIVKQFIVENRAFIEGKGFNITLNFLNETCLVMVDVDHIENILANLTENAIKYSNTKKNISISVQSEDQSIVLSYSDTGLGIAKKHQKNIFKKFYRVEDSLNAKTKGHGLGLNIVKNLVELNGGKIDVDSDIGVGTTFILKFPILVDENFSLKSHDNLLSPPKNMDKEKYA